MTDSRPVSPLWLWLVVLLVCIAGIGVSIELTRIHVNVHSTPDYHSFCALSERVNCDSVAESPWSVFVGMPVSAWGLLAYLLMASMAIWGWRSRKSVAPVGGLFALAAVAVVVSVVLAIISFSFIHSICILCFSSYGLNLVLLAVAWGLARRAAGGPVAAVQGLLRFYLNRPGLAVTLAAPLLVFTVALAVLWPAYWEHQTSQGPGGLPVGVTEEGDHWIGAVEPVLTIVEYSDYQCPHCSRGHQEVRRLVAEHPQQLRLVHRHYPLDHHCNPMLGGRPFHQHACRLARLAVCGGQQGKFWEVNDYLYEQARSNPQVGPAELARDLGVNEHALAACIAESFCKDRVMVDLQAGFALQLRGTPTFVIDGKPHPGRVPFELVKARLDAPSR